MYTEAEDFFISNSVSLACDSKVFVSVQYILAKLGKGSARFQKVITKKPRPNNYQRKSIWF